MRGISRFAWPAAVAVLLLADTAAAFPPSADDRRKFIAKILDSGKELTASAKPDAARARQLCNDARDIARRSDPNDYWIALIEDCLGAVDDFEKNKTAACDRYAAAADKYAKVRNDPKARSVEADIKRIQDARLRLGCAAVAAVAPPPKIGGPLSLQDLGEVMNRTATAHAMVLRKDAKNARNLCDEAKRHADRFDPSAFASGAIEECLAEVDLLEKNQPVACTRFGLASTHYATAKPNDPGGRQAPGNVQRLNKLRKKLGC
jgi:hypothetical protein